MLLNFKTVKRLKGRLNDSSWVDPHHESWSHHIFIIAQKVRVMSKWCASMIIKNKIKIRRTKSSQSLLPFICLCLQASFTIMRSSYIRVTNQTWQTERKTAPLPESEIVWVQEPNFCCVQPLVSKFDSPVARQKFSLLATAHDCETGLFRDFKCLPAFHEVHLSAELWEKTNLTWFRSLRKQTAKTSQCLYIFGILPFSTLRYYVTLYK